VENKEKDPTQAPRSAFFPEMKTMTLASKLSRQGGSNNQKGQTTTYAVVVGFLAAVSLFVAIKYFHDRNNDIVVHIPKVEVH
jgi:hypothetical protein